MWNKLDEEFISVSSVSSFKGKLQKINKDVPFSRLLYSSLARYLERPILQSY